MPPAQALGPRRGGGPLQHAAARGQRATVARRQRAGMREGMEPGVKERASGKHGEKETLRAISGSERNAKSVLMFCFLTFCL